MARHSLADRVSPASRSGFAGIAFAVWAAAFSVGVLSHEWQASQPPWSIGPVVAVAAFAVILKPTSVVRLVFLFALLAVELVTAMPNPWNHLLLVGVVGAAFVIWWLGLARRSPSEARDPAVMFERAAPYLRTAFILSWVFAAFAKLNTGFVDAVATCSVWILDAIPGLRVPPALHPVIIGGTLVLELAIPVLLFFHRTRPYAVAIGLGFHLVSAVGGHAAYSGLAWSFYLLFLPPAVLARAVVTARRAVPERAVRALAQAARTPLTLVALGALWIIGVGGLRLLPDMLTWPARRWGAAMLCLLWLGAWGWLLFRLRRHWIHARGPRASLRVRNVVLLLGLGALLVNAAMPYLGLKSRAAFTMYSNLRTEPGHWNHLVMPEAVRVFGWQDGEVRFVETDDDALQAEITEHESERTVLLDARRVVAPYPDATVRYELDGQERVASPVSADPVLGGPVSLVQQAVGAFRPFSDDGSCQH